MGHKSYKVIRRTKSGRTIIRTSRGDKVVGGGAVMSLATYRTRAKTILRQERRTGRRSSRSGRQTLYEAAKLTAQQIAEEERRIKAAEAEVIRKIQVKEDIEREKVRKAEAASFAEKKLTIAREIYTPYFESTIKAKRSDDYYKDVEAVVQREEKLQRKLYDFKSSAGMIVKPADPAAARFVKGAGGLFTDFVFAGGHFATALDKARVTGKGLVLPETRGDVWAEMKRAGAATPAVLKEQFTPKAENLPAIFAVGYMGAKGIKPKAPKGVMVKRSGSGIGKAVKDIKPIVGKKGVVKGGARGRQQRGSKGVQRKAQQQRRVDYMRQQRKQSQDPNIFTKGAKGRGTKTTLEKDPIKGDILRFEAHKRTSIGKHTEVIKFQKIGSKIKPVAIYEKLAKGTPKKAPKTTPPKGQTGRTKDFYRIYPSGKVKFFKKSTKQSTKQSTGKKNVFEAAGTKAGKTIQIHKPQTTKTITISDKGKIKRYDKKPHTPHMRDLGKKIDKFNKESQQAMEAPLQKTKTTTTPTGISKNGLKFLRRKIRSGEGLTKKERRAYVTLLQKPKIKTPKTKKLEPPKPKIKTQKPKIKPLTKMKTLQAIKFDVRTETKIGIASAIAQRSKIGQAARMRPLATTQKGIITLQRQEQDTRQDTRQAIKQEVAIKPILEPILKPPKTKKVTTKQEEIIKPIIPIPPIIKSTFQPSPPITQPPRNGRVIKPPKIRPPTRFFPPMFKRQERQMERPLLFKGFDVLVRRRGKFQTINYGALTKAEAVSLGAYRVGRTAAATFKVRPSALRTRQTFRQPSILKDFYRKGALFIEKPKRRIKSKGELQEITMKGLQAIKAKKQFKIKNIFGGKK